MSMFSRRVIFVLCAGLVSSMVFAAAPNPDVPEMDISGVPVVLGITIALVMLVRDQLEK
jgi:hypothetical protein